MAGAGPVSGGVAMTERERALIEQVAREMEEEIGTFFRAGDDQLTRWVRTLRDVVGRRVPAGRGVPRARRIPKRRSI